MGWHWFPRAWLTYSRWTRSPGNVKKKKYSRALGVISRIELRARLWMVLLPLWSRCRSETFSRLLERMATERNNENNVVGYRSGFSARSLIILFFQKEKNTFVACRCFTRTFDCRNASNTAGYACILSTLIIRQKKRIERETKKKKEKDKWDFARTNTHTHTCRDEVSPSPICFSCAVQYQAKRHLSYRAMQSIDFGWKAECSSTSTWSRQEEELN